MTLQDYLQKNLDRRVIDHHLRVDLIVGGKPKFYIHVSGADSDTLDFVVDGNQLIPFSGTGPVDGQWPKQEAA